LVPVHGSFNKFMPEAAKNIKGRVLILHGAEARVAPIEEVTSLISQLRAAKVDFELTLYSGTTASRARRTPRKCAPMTDTADDEYADDEYKVAMTRFFKDLLAQ
jgi:dienelactone hydrolase